MADVVPALAQDTSEEHLDDTGDSSDVPPDDDQTDAVPLVAQDDEDDADLIPVAMLDNRRYRWEPRRHESTTYWLLRTGRYYGKGRDTRESIYIGKSRDDPGGRAKRRGVDVAAVR